MQITIKTIQLKTKGTGEYGDWFMYKITSSDDVSYKCWADELLDYLHPGSIIEPDKITLGEYKGQEEREFKKFSIISGGTAAPAPAPDHGNGHEKANGMTPEAWAEKDRLLNDSIESQVAFKGIIGIAEAYITEGLNPREVPFLADCYSAALDWALARLQTEKPASKPAQKLAPAATTAKSEPTDDGLDRFYQTCMKAYALTKEKIAEKYPGLDLTTPEKRKTAWEYIDKQETDEKKAGAQVQEIEPDDLSLQQPTKGRGHG